MSRTSMIEPVTEPYVTLRLAGRLCGVPVGSVRDALRLPPITPVPLAPPEVAGNLNLRGRIVTAIDTRCRLGLPPFPPDVQPMALVTECKGELYALLVDQVLDVLTPEENRLEAIPPTLSAVWARYSTCLYRLNDALMIVLDLSRLLAITPKP